MDTNLIVHIIPLIVGADLLAHPESSGEALEIQAEGDVRHAVRVALGPAGFLVDLLWADASFLERVRAAIRSEIARASAQRGASAPAVEEAPSPPPPDADSGSAPGVPTGADGTIDGVAPVSIVFPSGSPPDRATA